MKLDFRFNVFGIHWLLLNVWTPVHYDHIKNNNNKLFGRNKEVVSIICLFYSHFNRCPL